MAQIEMYTTSWCSYCAHAFRLLDARGVGRDEIQQIDVEATPNRRAEMEKRSGRTTVPQIFIDGKHIGGFDDLRALDVAGGLRPLLG